MTEKTAAPWRTPRRKNMPLEQAFMDKTSPEPMSGCWLWIGSANQKGYGLLSFKGKNVAAHRLSYRMFVGPIPDGLMVCHHCDVPCCVNPVHLFVGTNKENIQDALNKGRWACGENRSDTKLSASDVLEIRGTDTSAPGARMATAKKFGISVTYLNQLKQRRKWKHI